MHQNSIKTLILPTAKIVGPVLKFKHEFIDAERTKAWIQVMSKKNLGCKTS